MLMSYEEQIELEAKGQRMRGRMRRTWKKAGWGRKCGGWFEQSR